MERDSNTLTWETIAIHVPHNRAFKLLACSVTAINSIYIVLAQCCTSYIAIQTIFWFFGMKWDSYIVTDLGKGRVERGWGCHRRPVQMGSGQSRSRPWESGTCEVCGYRGWECGCVCVGGGVCVCVWVGIARSIVIMTEKGHYKQWSYTYKASYIILAS